MYFSLNSKNFLIDTNIFLEILLDRKGSIECQKILRLKYRYFISDFSLYSISILLINYSKKQVLIDFIKDIEAAEIEIIRLNLNDFYDVVNNAERFGLDFDDTYQYTISAKNNLLIISYDKHFDKTDLKRIKPKQLLKMTKY
jgi:predicted nucleic acid-binding protein